MAAVETPIVLYQYVNSPYSTRVAWYLALNRIKYQQCMQPRTMPRPDIHRLGVKYRRIPILAIGRDVYLDTRHILAKLSELPAGRENVRLSVATTPEQRALQRLLNVFIMDTGFSRKIVQLVVYNNPVLNDPAFVKDRSEMIGNNTFFQPETLKATRPEAIRVVRSGFEFLEETLLSDGREWLLGTEGPSLGDLEIGWAFLWLERVPGALPEEWFSREMFPRVFSWMERFKGAVREAEGELGEIRTLSGDEAAEKILGSEYFEGEGEVDEGDALVRQLGLRKGCVVRVWPTDTGVEHKEVGRLVSCDGREVVVEVEGEGGAEVRVHVQRHGFAVAPFEE